MLIKKVSHNVKELASDHKQIQDLETQLLHSQKAASEATWQTKLSQHCLKRAQVAKPFALKQVQLLTQENVAFIDYFTQVNTITEI